MKRNFIIILTLAGMLSHAQNIVGYVNAPVTVQTLMAVKGGFQITSVGKVNVSPKGKIKLINSADSQLIVANPDNFVFDYGTETEYAQLIADYNYTVNPGSKIDFKHKLNAPTTNDARGSTVQVGFPFEDYTLNNVREDGEVTGIPGNYPLQCAPGNCHPMYWNAGLAFQYENDSLLFKPVNKLSDKFERGAYYIVYQKRGNTTMDMVTNKRSYKGQPNPANLTIDFPRFKTDNGGLPTDISPGKRTSYNIQYKNFVYDPFIGNDNYPTGDNTVSKYGYSLVQVSNPYTSNIDLTKSAELNALASGTTGIWSYGQNFAQSTSNINKFCVAQIVGGTSGYLGDEECVLIKPFQTFILKNDPSRLTSFVFRDELKTFEYTPSKGRNGNVDPLPKMARGGVTMADMYQVKLKLTDVNDKQNFNHTYVAASSLFETGSEVNEAEILSDFDGAAVYTYPEITKNLAKKTYINRINVKSEGTAIPVGFEGGKGNYAFTVDLSENGEKLDKSVRNLSNVNFYFLDKVENKLVPITTDFKYTFASKDANKEKAGERFEIFVGRASTGQENIDDPGKDQGNVSQTNVDKTEVYKQGSTYYVRFASTWKRADIAVYDMNGRLISNFKNISAENKDQELPLKESNSILVVKMTSDKGEVVTQKVLK